MTWYYVENGQQQGPVSQTEFDALMQRGQLTDQTLVWRLGMANWLPYGQVNPGGGSTLAAPSPSAVAESASDVACAECHRIFPKDQTIQYGSAWVCASCKPVFVQKLQEGAVIPTTSERMYAGFWLRFAAYFMDQIIQGFAGAVLGLVIGLAVPGTTPEDLVFRQILSGTTGFFIGMAYYVFFNGKYGATPGKMACRIRVVTAEGQPITYGRAFGRFFASILSGMICAIGYIMAAFDEEKRALHDRICNTRVIILS